jgi:uncharacterized protein YbjT (DUF2867 family)
MKITLTGSLGNISKPLAKKLINNGHQVTIISSNPDKIVSIEALGAKAAIGSVADLTFLTEAFAGADFVYTMVPPNFGANNLYQYITGTGQNYAEAIKLSGVTRVINLSSMGAHLESAPAPIAAATEVERTLNKLDNVAIKHLRCPFFFVNYYGLISMVKNMGILGSNYPGDTRMLLVHPQDIAAAAAEEIEQGFTGKSIRNVVSDQSTPQQVATVLGTAIDKPDLPWVEFTDEQALQGIIQSGVPTEIAKSFVETGIFLRSGQLWEDFDSQKAQVSGNTKLEDFATEFADKYNNG